MQTFDTQQAIVYLSQTDPVMGELIDQVGPYKLQIELLQSPFESLVRSIIYQQLSGRAAATIHRRLQGLFADQASVTPEALLVVPDEILRSVGVSGAKTAALKDLASKTLEGVVPPLNELISLDDEQIIERLTAVRGIGRWTVEMMLMFRLGRADVLPVTDLGVRKGFMQTYRTEALPTPTRLRDHGERWRPYRSVASWYLWRSLELDTQSR